ncbi:MAG TPA: dienelactone hydrolase family protein, partial [Solirubrobacteraceae bacterium]
MPDVTYHPADTRELKAYVAHPRGQGPWPGVVVVMDARSSLAERARRLHLRIGIIGFCMGGGFALLSAP